jgi:hypothetical protein
MKPVISFALSIVLNVVVLLLAPFLVLAYIVRVHTIEYLQSRRIRVDRLAVKAPAHLSEADPSWTMFGGVR